MLIDYGILGLSGVLIYELIQSRIKSHPIKTNTTLKINKDIYLDLRYFPSLSVSGVTMCGKSYLVENMLKSSTLPITLMNAYENDYNTINCTRINNNIKEYLTNITSDKEPRIIVIDEVYSLDKEALKILTVLLTKNRHYNKYFILIMQSLTKELAPFKSLLSARLVMRQLQSSDYLTSAGTDVTDYLPLKNREFILISDNIYKGKSMSIK